MHALFIHGVGEQAHDFAADSIKHLRKAVSPLYAASVHWAPLADRHEHEFMRKIERKGSKGNMLQRLTIGTLTDALAYQSNQRLREEIHYLIDLEYSKLRVNDATIFCHSLGGLIFLDYLRSRPGAQIGKLVTFGCNVGLFHMGMRFECPRQVSKPGSWLNLFDREDMLGYPLAVSRDMAHVKDVEVSVGGWLTGWTGLSHVAYFGDRTFWRETVPSHL